MKSTAAMNSNSRIRGPNARMFEIVKSKKMTANKKNSVLSYKKQHPVLAKDSPSVEALSKYEKDSFSGIEM